VIEIVEKETWPDRSFKLGLDLEIPASRQKGSRHRDLGHLAGRNGPEAGEDALAAANKELSQLSRTDTLSGLLNRRDMHEMLQGNFKMRARAKASGCRDEFAVVLFDIDRFKTINDSFGHQAGDQVIRHVAEVLRSGIRTTDTLFRYGGDEFLLLLPGTGLDGARVVASKLLAKLRKTACPFEGQKIRLTASAGIADSEEARTVSALLKKADQRLYLSKKAGRDRTT